MQSFPIRPGAKMRRCTKATVRYMTTTNHSQKRDGDISDAFASLSGIAFKPLEPRFAALKASMIAGREDALRQSWSRLLRSLRQETALIRQEGSRIIPIIDFKHLDDANEQFRNEHRKRGVAVIRNVIPKDEALSLKEDLRQYIAANPGTKSFPADNPQVFELYWSKSQIKARSHANMLRAQKFLMKSWHSKDPNALVSTSHPAVYADRLRMRLPGDAKFALGPHVDGGSCERWESEGYGRGGVYDEIFNGRWEKFDAWEASCRLPVKSDLYQGVGAASMFRMFQGWLSMSSTGPYEGTLLVNPLFSRATAYFLLRPFFSAKRPPADPQSDTVEEAYLDESNWELNLAPDSWMQGATPGHGQELRPQLHPHLDLANTMVHIPRVEPGDYVSWHCDTIHAVDQVHAGQSDSSVMYIPACPLTVENAEFMARQREAFLNGTPCPDFGGGKGEADHIGRAVARDVEEVNGEQGMQAFGLGKWDELEEGLTIGQRELMKKANAILGFA